VLVGGFLGAQGQSEKRRIAIYDFDYSSVKSEVVKNLGADSNVGHTAAEMLLSPLIESGAYEVMDRSRVEAIMKEQNLKFSSRFDSSQAVAYGKILQVDAIVAGTVNDLSVEVVEKVKGVLGVGRKTSILKVTVDLTAQMISTEVAHLCQSGHVQTTVGESTVTLGRVWSNRAAAADHFRCAPIPSGEGPEVLGVPVLTQRVSFTASEATLGVALAEGESTTVDVNLISDAPTGGPFYIEAIDVAAHEGRPPELGLSLDANSGQNGDVVHLTITRLRPPNPAAPVNGVVFKLGASLSPTFTDVHYSAGFVSNSATP